MAYRLDMTGIEFKEAIKNLGLTQREFARETGMSMSAVNEWATGRAKVPQIAAAYIRLRLEVDAFRRRAK